MLLEDPSGALAGKVASRQGLADMTRLSLPWGSAGGEGNRVGQAEHR